jgi:uncharacterized phage protein (TIGR01671 family)
MSREIKFRAWNIMARAWAAAGDIVMQHTPYSKLSELVPNPFLAETDEVVIMQFTGLKDKNGQEIYEGDIVKLNSWEPQYFQVGFDRGGFCFYRPGDVFYNDAKYLETAEVIGNIYENSELLNP